MNEALGKAFADAIRGQIGGNREHGWGVDDSSAVIESVIATDAENEITRLIAAGKEPKLYTPSEDCMKLIKKVINPSAFRQELERTKGKNGETLLQKSEKAAREKNFLADLL